MKQKITEEEGVHKAWKAEAENVKTMDELSSFLLHLTEDFEHDYGTIVHAMDAGMLATFSFFNNSSQGGITGFQAQCLGWAMAKKFLSLGDHGSRIIRYENLLYPQHEHEFEKILPLDVWTKVRETAQKNIEQDGTDAALGIKAHPDVVDHWKKLVAGIVPFGYSVAAE